VRSAPTFAYSATFRGACWAEANRGAAAMLPAASDKTVLRLNMALPPLIIFGIDFQSNRDIPRYRRLLPYYWQRSLCQAVTTAVHEVPGAQVMMRTSEQPH